MTPYEGLPDRAFWRPAVADRSIFDIESLWTPKIKLMPDMAISTFGSCFSQQIGRSLHARGYNWLITEPSPPGMSPASALDFNYGVFTCRTGNIYTTSMLHQWLSWAFGNSQQSTEHWKSSGLFLDPTRPNIEPTGFEYLEEMFDARNNTLNCLLECLKRSDVLMFTLGLTERWINQSSGYEYQICPGIKGGDYDSNLHKFHNHDYVSTRYNLERSIEIMRKINPKLNIILTVSPVPLTATMSNSHILTASQYTKSILRAVAGDVSNNCDFVDYFPSYEVVNSPTSRGILYKSNQRQITRTGVDLVINQFISAFGKNTDAEINLKNTSPENRTLYSNSEEICDEHLLEAFSPN